MASLGEDILALLHTMVPAVTLWLLIRYESTLVSRRALDKSGLVRNSIYMVLMMASWCRWLHFYDTPSDLPKNIAG
jgi:hypothetical protein